MLKLWIFTSPGNITVLTERTSLRTCYYHLISEAKARLTRSITPSIDRAFRGKSGQNETARSSKLKYVYLANMKWGVLPNDVFFYPYAAVFKRIFRSGSNSKKGILCCGSTRYPVELHLSSHKYRAKRPLAFVKANACVLILYDYGGHLGSLFYERINTNYSCCSQHYILYEHFKNLTFWYMQHMNGILIR